MPPLQQLSHDFALLHLAQKRSACERRLSASSELGDGDGDGGGLPPATGPPPAAAAGWVGDPTSGCCAAVGGGRCQAGEAGLPLALAVFSAAALAGWCINSAAAAVSGSGGSGGWPKGPSRLCATVKG